MSHVVKENKTSLLRRYRGVEGASKGWLTAKLSKEFPKLVVVTKNQRTAEELLSDLTFFESIQKVFFLPPWDTLPLEVVSPSIDVTSQRLYTLDSITRLDSFICVTSAEALMQKIIPRSYFEKLAFNLELNQEIDKNALIQNLLNCGFHPVPVVSQIGDMAIRGTIIDYYGTMNSRPIRLEFDNCKLLNIRLFDCDSQRSLENKETVRILPVRELLPLASHNDCRALLENAIVRTKSLGQTLEVPPREIAQVLDAINTGSNIAGIELLQAVFLDKLDSLFSYFTNDIVLALDDHELLKQGIENYSDLISEHAERLTNEHVLFPKTDSVFISTEEFWKEVERYDRCTLNSIDLIEGDQDNKSPIIPIRVERHTTLISKLKTKQGSGKGLVPLRQAIEKWRRKNFNLAFVVGSQSRMERLRKELLALNIDAEISSHSGWRWFDSPRKAPVVILEGYLSSGFTLIDQQVAFIAENEIYPERSYRKSAASKTSLKKLLNSLSQLEVGDYIVHADYGIGLYQGLKHLEIDGEQGDFLHIEYADSRLFLPVHNIGKVQKFFAAEGQKPQVDKLGSSRWLKTRIKVRQSVIALAGDLIKLYATRSVAKGWRFEPWGAEDERFSDNFPFNETHDQTKAIREVIEDMSKDRPMDRLVCGDVGFGKTEVALRAAFKCTEHARQVALLVPTTILVEQHRTTFANRFDGYPVKVGALSRFYSSVENKETLRQLASGELDIVIGTHRLLQKDVFFKDLGLVIIDEEHRFGVQQKEKLKQLKKQVDFLSLTATPIPRTLHMSLLDIRDTSLISTPPNDRRVIRTYVATYSETLVRDAILRELQRGGQCFFLHNRVQSIDGVAARLQELVPEASFQFAHGQMSECQLEDIMQRFLKQEIDVLVCTTIIESGLDIPNANTIIIDRADHFGLAQLYQLRGRVGRSSRQAYAYFLIPKTTKLGPDAQKRLQVLQSIDDLGMGFNLAIRDLEIRGAGNLLGKEQSGNVLSVGFELYMKILKEAVLNIKGEELPPFEAVDPEMKLNIPAFIPEYYIPDISERLVMYQRLSGLLKPDEGDLIQEEILDRFGELPSEVLNLIEVMRIRALLRSYAISKAEISGAKILISFTPISPIDNTKIVKIVEQNKDKFKFSKNLVLSMIEDSESSKKPYELFLELQDILSKIEKDR